MQPKRYERPASVNLSDVRNLRSRSEGGRLIEERPKEETQEYSCRIPIRVERVPLQESVRSTNNRVFFRSQPPPQQKVLNYSPERNQSILERNQPYQTPKFKSETSLEKAATLQQENDSLCVNLGEHRIRPDLNQWDHQILTQLGVNDSRIRSKILTELEIVRKGGPLKDVRNTEFDQVLAFETALTPRDLSVTGGRMGCLQVTKVDGSCLPFKENDCLLEINGVSGEQFKSALMLTKFISDADGQPIRFVILRRKEKEDDSTSQTDSSSGISSSPLTPVENVV
ncbi:unnamed protein product, partial [Mesorhabditis belari]|uniref:PDZ domain-containing protein n=1 Tax=Mesorhabditis belari TaxID=2138241 RepID=A0AAF3FFJ8_9BILA